MMPASRRRSNAPMIVTFCALLPVLAACTSRADRDVLQGQVEVRKVNVSSKIPGRLDSIFVREGDRVRAGQLMAVLRSPEFAAKAEQASGALDAAVAQQAKAERGARVQDIGVARANWQRAVAAESLATITFARMQTLFDEGVVAAQRFDEARAQRTAAQLTTTAARNVLDLTVAGARSEDRTAASALVRQARGGRAEVESYIDEMRITAPIDGEITQRTVEPGEIVAAGLAIVTVADLSDAWVTFNVREDRLSGLAIDSVLHVTLPALGDREVALTVSYIAALGDFATWRATGEAGGFDLRTFEVRARPSRSVEGLRPGMTVLLRLSALGRPSPRARR
jgi:HlyD family secretion protein